MKKNMVHARWWGLAVVAFSVGCCCNEMDVDRFADIPSGAIPEPAHTTVRRHFEMQAAKAEADDFVFYRHEFYMDGKELGPYGQYHLKLVASRLSTVPFPVLIQAVPDPKLNEQRRATVVAALKRAGLDEIEPRVIVGFPEAEGMGGEEAERLYQSVPQAGTGINGQGGLFRNNGFQGNNIYNNGLFGNQRNLGRGGLYPFFQ